MFALLRPGDTLLSISSKPYDTLDEVIGIRENKSSLKSFNINYKQVDLIDNDFDYEKIKDVITSEKIKVITKKEDIVEKVVDNNYLFLGDSITEQYDLKKYYEGYPVVNSGVSGDFTSSIVENMKKRVYDYNPSKVFLLIGINDLRNGKDVSEIVSNTKEIIKLIKENRPYSEIYLESIYPINKTDDDKISDSVKDIEFDNEKIIEVNNLLKDLAKDEKITYVDLYNKLVDDDGNLNISYTKDGLHISSEGYEFITKELMKYIKD